MPSIKASLIQRFGCGNKCSKAQTDINMSVDETSHFLEAYQWYWENITRESLQATLDGTSNHSNHKNKLNTKEEEEEG